tara:strand:+ start:75 stop:617 length:543 start_codon:yes stop_codon:yes gene_type:complete
MNIAWSILLVLVCGICWLTNLVGVPGNWLMVGASTLYVFLIPIESRLALTWPLVGMLLVLATTGELVEIAASAWSTGRHNASRRSKLLSVIGSIIGALCGFLIGAPAPPIGPILGSLLCACTGAFLGAFIGETWKGRNLDETWQVGKAAFWGRLLGAVGKIGIGFVIILLIFVGLVTKTV